MIKNERQYRITKAQAQKSWLALTQLKAGAGESAHLHPRLRQAEMDAIESQWESLQAEIAEYEAPHVVVQEEVTSSETFSA